MLELDKNEMAKVHGGAVNWTLVAGVGALLSLIAGMIDGYINPKKCNTK